MDEKIRVAVSELRRIAQSVAVAGEECEVEDWSFLADLYPLTVVLQDRLMEFKYEVLHVRPPEVVPLVGLCPLCQHVVDQRQEIHVCTTIGNASVLGQTGSEPKAEPS